MTAPKRHIRIPAYTHHKPTNTARVRIAGVYHSLGRFNSPSSWAKYDRLIAEWKARGCPTVSNQRVLTLDELILAYWRWLEPQHSQAVLWKHRSALKTARAMYSGTDIEAFGPRALKTVRDAMIAKGWSRRTINEQIALIVRMFRWAAEDELIDGSQWHALRSVKSLRRGCSNAIDHPPVRPVAVEIVSATLSELTPTVATMVRMQLLTGARPCEVCSMTTGEIDTTGDVWLYRPGRHKTAHLGRSRTIGIGSQAQALLAPRLRRDLAEPVFSPVDSLAEHRAALRAARRSHPSTNRARDGERVRSAEPPQRVPYSTSAYRRAIARACVRAGIVPPWHPNQLRHTRATEIRRAMGLEAASAVLGHASLSTTEIYAERDHSIAAEVARRMG